MGQVAAVTRREMYGLLTQRWILILVALLGMELLVGIGPRANSIEAFDLGNAALTMGFLGSLVMMGLSLDAITKERTSSVLDLMLTRRTGRRQILLGKLLAYLMLAVPVALLGILTPLGAATVLGAKISFEKYPLDTVLVGTTVYLSFYAALGVALSPFCRSLQSAFALGGAIWVFTSPLVWDFLVLRGIQRQLSESALAMVNVLNPLGAFMSMIRMCDSFGGSGGMNLTAPTPVAYGVVIAETVLVALFAVVAFDRQEEPGYQS